MWIISILNEGIAAILRASGDFYSLYLPGRVPKSSPLILPRYPMPLCGNPRSPYSEEGKSRGDFLFDFGNLELNVMPLTGCTWVIQSKGSSCAGRYIVQQASVDTGNRLWHSTLVGANAKSERPREGPDIFIFKSNYDGLSRLLCLNAARPYMTRRRVNN